MYRPLKRAFRKNGPEFKAFLLGQMPGFVLGRGDDARDEVPVFVFHDVAPERFERQLLFLQANGYRTLDSSELEASVHRGHGGGRDVVLTFDDATWTFWTFAFPLLRRYRCRAILFAIPGLVPEDRNRHPNLDDAWAGRCSLPELNSRARTQPLCTWHELAVMHQSGLVDIQSHSLTHTRAPVSPRVVDFLRPDVGSYLLADVAVRSAWLDAEWRPRRLGAPVFESASRLACRRRFLENPELVEALTGYVERRGGREFFRRPGWRRHLRRALAEWPDDRRGSFETEADMVAAVRAELSESKRRLEERLPGKRVRHFCYPWLESAPLADRLAVEAGYRTVHYGPVLPRRLSSDDPLRVRRLPEEYLFTLPGAGRVPFWSVWQDRLRGFARRPHSATP